MAGMTLPTRTGAPLKTLADVKLRNIDWARRMRELRATDTEVSFFNDPLIRDNTRKVARVVHPAPHGTYLVTSQPTQWRVRAYTLWFCRESGEIVLLSELNEYPTRGRAHQHAKTMANADWVAREAIARQRARDAIRRAAGEPPVKYDVGLYNTSGEAAIYSLPYLQKKYGRETA